MFVSALPDPTCNSEKSANGGNKQILLLLLLLLLLFLLVPRITFNSEGQSLYASKFITNKKMDISERRNHEIKFFNTEIRTFQYYKWNKQTEACICFYHQ